jgi:hypothetical protein
MPFKNYPSGFAQGVSIRNLPIVNSYGGDIYWVDSGAGSDGYTGTFDQPFGSVDFAIGQCTASNQDIIMVKAGHQETIAAASGLALDVAGVTIIGMGRGSLRPTFNFTTTASTCVVSAANCAIHNCLFTGGIDEVVTMFTINAADFHLIDCETKDVTGQMTSCITTTANADRFLISGHRHLGSASAGGANWLEWVGGDGCIVEDCWIDGNFSAANIEQATTACTNARIGGGGQNLYLRNRNASVVGITMVSTSTGQVGPNIFVRLLTNAANITEAVVGADMNFFDPIMISNADGERGMQWNGTASTDA